LERELERKRKGKVKLKLERKLERERKLKLSGGGLMPVPLKFNAYTHRLGFLCLASYRDGQTKKTRKKNNKLGPVAPRGVDPRSPNFQGM